MSAFGANARCLLHARGPLGHAVEAGKSGGNLGLTLTAEFAVRYCGREVQARANALVKCFELGVGAKKFVLLQASVLQKGAERAMAGEMLRAAGCTMMKSMESAAAISPG